MKTDTKKEIMEKERIMDKEKVKEELKKRNYQYGELSNKFATLKYEKERNDLAVYDKGFKEAIKQRNAEVKKLIKEWYNDDKTCSGKPHCLIEECDLCVNCFDELLQKLGLEGKDE